MDNDGKLTVEEKLEVSERENYDLRAMVSQIRYIIENCLIGVDVTVKVGAVVGLWFFPMPADRWAQSIALAVFIFLVTSLSKGFVKIKQLKEMRP